MNLRLKHISLPLASFVLEVEAEIQEPATVLFGPSGAGKTSLLELLAGLRHPASALIQLDGHTVTDTTKGVFVPPRHRRIGYVPQDLALFPHLSVRGNLLYGHRRRQDDNPLLTFEHVTEALEINQLLRRGVRDLSGGEKRRVALARALLASPKLLLLDEPLSNLDRNLKSKILSYLTLIRDEFHLPMIYVTHDHFEAMALAGHVIVLLSGRIVQTGPPLEVFNRPVAAALSALEEVETVQPGRVIAVAGNLITVAVGQTRLISAAEPAPPAGSDVFVCVRAEDVVLAKSPDAGLRQSSARNRLPGIVRALTPHGPMMRIDLDCGFPLAALLTKQACDELALRTDDSVLALIKAPHVRLVPRTQS
jgi:molybdenum ABC transporter ATP-binding protein